MATITVSTMVLAFFYVREKQLWEDKKAIESLEARGGKAILEFKAELQELRILYNAQQRSLWELDKRLETRGYKKYQEDHEGE